MKTIEVTNDEWEAITLFRATKQAVEKLEEAPTLYSGYTEEQIQIIIDGGYLVRTDGSDWTTSIKQFDPGTGLYLLATGHDYKEIQLVREVGHVQPWFGGEYDGSPADLVMTYDGERWLGGRAGWDQRTWPDVTKYILVEKAE